MQRIAPSAQIEERIETLLAEGIDDADRLAEVGGLGALLILQRALEDEVARCTSASTMPTGKP